VDAERVEIRCIDAVEESSGRSLARRQASIFDVDRLVAKSTAHRNRRGEAHGLDSRERADLCFDRDDSMAQSRFSVLLVGSRSSAIWISAGPSIGDRLTSEMQIRVITKH
jgi:hypothetical protein